MRSAGALPAAQAETHDLVVVGSGLLLRLGQRLVVRECAVGDRIFNERRSPACQRFEYVHARDLVVVEHGVVEVVGQVLCVGS